LKTTDAKDNLIKEKGFLVFYILILWSTASITATAGIADEQSKPDVARQVAQKWMAIGNEQYKRGLFKQAELSLLYAVDYQEYLNSREQKHLRELLSDVQKAVSSSINNQALIDSARQLIEQDRLAAAKNKLMRIEQSGSVSKLQQNQLSDALKQIKQKLNDREQEISRLYKQAMKLYRNERFEQARSHFTEIEQILSRISSQDVGVSTGPQQVEEPAEHICQKTAEPSQQQVPGKPLMSESAPQKEKIAEFARPITKAEVEPNQMLTEGPLKQADISPAKEIEGKSADRSQETPSKKEKLIRSYTQAIVKDAITKARDYNKNKRTEEAKAVLEKARQIIIQNREYLGQDIFGQYDRQLQELSEQIAD